MFKTTVISLAKKNNKILGMLCILCFCIKFIRNWKTRKVFDFSKCCTEYRIIYNYIYPKSWTEDRSKKKHILICVTTKCTAQTIGILIKAKANLYLETCLYWHVSKLYWPTLPKRRWPTLSGKDVDFPFFYWGLFFQKCIWPQCLSLVLNIVQVI